MRKRRVLAKTASLVSFLLLIGVGVGLAVLRARGGQLLSVQTGSMEPAIHTGSLVLVNRVAASDLQTGDVITYVNPANNEQTITHRISQITDQSHGRKQFIVKGDANRVFDPPVAEDRVVGRVDTAVPYAGIAIDFLRTWPGLIGIVYLPALVVVGNEIRKLAKYYKSQQPYLAPGRSLAPQKTSHPARSAAVVIVLTAALAWAVPAWASLQSVVTLSGNSIAGGVVSPPPQAETNGIMLRRVFVVCNENDPQTTSIEVSLYNSSRQPATISGWGVYVGGAPAFVFPASTQLPARHQQQSTFPAPVGVTYSTGSLELRDADGAVVDAEAWSWPANRPCRFSQ